VALGNSDDESWNRDKELRRAISVLKIFRVTQWKPLAMVASEKFDEATFKRLLNSIVVISFRYNVIAKLQTNEMEKIYSKAAINLYKSESPNFHKVLADLRDLYVVDEDFKNYFYLKQFNTSNSTDKKLLRYTLYSIESQEDNGSLYDFEIDNGTIEHILPESYSEIWHESFDEDAYERNIYLIGNLTLLEPAKNNKEASDKAITEKIQVYSESKYAMTKRIQDPEWTSTNIRNRQAHMARLACAIWQIQFSAL
jgi:replicative superfamily II helicase